MPSDFEVELLRLEEEIARRRAINDFAFFCKLAWHVVEPTIDFVGGWHVDAIGMHLEAMLQGKIRNLVINIPPRMSKSTLIAVMLPAWVWLRKPGHKFLYASYAASLSVRDSIKCRRLIESQWYRSFFRPQWMMNADQNRQDEFSNTLQGIRTATSVDGAGTGRGGDWIIADDPSKATDAFSKAVRDSTNEWWDFEMSTRSIDPKTVRKIVIMQRLHPEDLTGHVLKQGGYDLLKLPMEYEPPESGDKPKTSIGWEDPRNEPGELLSPNRFGRAEVADLKIRLGSMGYIGQMQQRPTAREGAIIKRSWLQYFVRQPQGFEEQIMTWDMTFKGGGNSDFVVGQVWGRYGANKFLLDQVRERMTFTETIRAFKGFCAKHPQCFVKIVEDTANGPAVIDALSREIPGIIPYKPKDSKEARLNAVAPEFEAGNVHIPTPALAPWINDWIEEIMSFPNGANDDQVDCTSSALLRFRDSGLDFMKAMGTL